MSYVTVNCVGEKKVVMNFIYNESVLPTEIQPRFVEQVENVYIFEAATSLAYIAVPVTECQAHGTSGQVYDLSPLIHPHAGWNVATKGAGDKYFINICHSVGNVTATSCSGECFVFIIYHTILFHALLGEHSELIIIVLMWKNFCLIDLSSWSLIT